MLAVRLEPGSGGDGGVMVLAAGGNSDRELDW